MKRKILPYNPKLKSLAKALRQNMTFAEVLLWNELKQKKIYGYDFDRQRPINNYIVDFYCKDLMLAIEVDGISHYSEEAFNADNKRQSRIETFGVKFLRFDDEEVRKDMPNVLRSIEGWILDWEEANPEKIYPGREPTPSPSEEGS
ncbi:MAG: DNA methylase [Bacteroidetes bacterium]|nr:MAG: DNA methylase [Bacteroidota bacterium]